MERGVDMQNGYISTTWNHMGWVMPTNNCNYVIDYPT